MNQNPPSPSNAGSNNGSIINAGGGLQLLSQMSQNLQAMQDNGRRRVNEFASLASHAGVPSLAGPNAAIALSAMQAALPVPQFTPAEIQAGVQATQAAQAQRLQTQHQHQLLGKMLSGLGQSFAPLTSPTTTAAAFGNPASDPAQMSEALLNAQKLVASQAQAQNVASRQEHHNGSSEAAAAMLSAAAAIVSGPGAGLGAGSSYSSGRDSGSHSGHHSSASGSGGGGEGRTKEKVQAKRAANRLHSRQSRKRKKDFIERLKEQTELLQRTKAMLEILPVVILSHNQDGVITYAIAATKRLLGYSVDELLGTNFFNLLGKDSVKVAKRACPRSPEDRQTDGNDSSGRESTDSESSTLTVSVFKHNGEEELFEMDTKRFSSDEIVRYLQLAKSNLSSSSSSNSSTSPPSSHDSSEEGGSNISEDTNSDSNTHTKRSKRPKMMPKVDANSHASSSSSTSGRTSSENNDGNPNDNANSNDARDRKALRRQERGPSDGTRETTRERLTRQTDESDNRSSSPSSSNENEAT
jgi:PAS domain-containing protein